jgi:sirohydrochlorin ferrochelatase
MVGMSQQGEAMGPADLETTGVVIVDHGSRRAEANDMLLEVARRYAAVSHYRIVEPAHMEVAEPSMAAAFARCVARGARRVVVMPYFLAPGKHWDQDIPRLAAEAARPHAGLSFLVTAPLGLHPMIYQVIEARIDYCLQHACGAVPACEVCQGSDRCALRPNPAE